MNSKRLLIMLGFPLMFLLSISARAQNRVISGKVTDSKSGQPIAGVSVLVKATRIGTQTLSDGAFQLNAPSSATTLVFSYVGYARQEAAIGTGNITVALEQATSSLNDIVVVGYGTARKKDLTGSVVSVTAKDFVRGPITTPEQLIAGKVPGVQINSNSGQPGAGSRIRIRGGTSLNASNDPLIVIDGVPIDNNGISGSPNPLSLINPNDIESFNILKDASSAAIYGARAANGVILITTKKGVGGGGVKINFSTLNSLSVKTGEVDVLTAGQFRNLVNQSSSASDIAMLGTANTNWQDEIYQTAFATDNNIAVSGGIKGLPYRLSLGYLNQDGILRGSNLQRTAVTLNLSPKLFDNHLSVNTNVKYSYSKNNFANQGAIGAAVYFDPTQPVYSNKDQYGGYWEWLTDETTLNGLATKNPLGLLNDREDKSNVNRIIGNVQLDYKFHFLPELHANLNLGLDHSDGKGTVYVPATAASQYTRGGSNNKYEQTKDNKLLEFYLNYVNEITVIRSRVDAVAGYTYQDWVTKSPAFADYRADQTIFKDAGIPFQTQNTLISFYGRLNYSLMDRYLVTLTMRRDGSSRFSEDNRWGNFPSAALAWNINNESFMRGNNIFSNLKVRFGWGITGQQEGISDYGYQSNVFYGDSAARYQFGNNYYIVARPQGYDANLKWEETEAVNVGLDMGFANNRVNFTIDYYQKETRDLLASVPAPAGTNFTNILLTNVGSIKNKGLEFGLNLSPFRGNDFSLDLGYNLTYIIENDITKLQLVNDPNYLGAETGGTGFNNVQIHSVGYRPATFFLYKQVYDETGKPIEGLYEDKNDDGVINDFDKYWVKNPEPKVFMGLSLNTSYKKFSAGFVMRASLGNYMYNAIKANSGIIQNVITGQNYLSNAHVDILETDFHNRQTWSDYYLENASFLRMDNAYINYNVGSIMKGRANLRVNLSCQNVFVITKYSGLDPEINGGIDNTIYPRPRMYAIGLNVDL